MRDISDENRDAQAAQFGITVALADPSGNSRRGRRRRHQERHSGRHYRIPDGPDRSAAVANAERPAVRCGPSCPAIARCRSKHPLTVSAHGRSAEARSGPPLLRRRLATRRAVGRATARSGWLFRRLHRRPSGVESTAGVEPVIQAALVVPYVGKSLFDQVVVGQLAGDAGLVGAVHDDLVVRGRALERPAPEMSQ